MLILCQYSLWCSVHQDEWHNLELSLFQLYCKGDAFLAAKGEAFTSLRKTLANMELRWILELEGCQPCGTPRARLPGFSFPPRAEWQGLCLCWVEPRSCCWHGAWTDEVFGDTNHHCALLSRCWILLLLHTQSSAVGCPWSPDTSIPPGPGPGRCCLLLDMFPGNWAQLFLAQSRF